MQGVELKEQRRNPRMRILRQEIQSVEIGGRKLEGWKSIMVSKYWLAFLPQ
jgi:hypothetical protein